MKTPPTDAIVVPFPGPRQPKPPFCRSGLPPLYANDDLILRRRRRRIAPSPEFTRMPEMAIRLDSRLR
jgi:hypothetical protein